MTLPEDRFISERPIPPLASRPFFIVPIAAVIERPKNAALAWAWVRFEGASNNPVQPGDFVSGKIPSAHHVCRWGGVSRLEIPLALSTDAIPGRKLSVTVEGLPGDCLLTDTALTWTRDTETGVWSATLEITR